MKDEIYFWPQKSLVWIFTATLLIKLLFWVFFPHTSLIFHFLSRPWRFNELKKDLEGISQKVLTDSLRSMEEDGIITRIVYAEVPPRVEYSLSELGESMRPIIKSMEEWGISYKNNQ